MEFKIEKYYNNKTYKRNGKDYYLCKIRNKLVQANPEEKVRQAVISYMMEELLIPKHLIEVEFPLARMKKGARGRIDIAVFNQEDFSLMIVECKAQNIMLTNQTVDQLKKYDAIAQADFMLITNGNNDTFISFAYDNTRGEYINLDSIPTFNQMLDLEIEPSKEKIHEFHRVGDEFFSNTEELKNIYWDILGEDTVDYNVKAIIKLWEALIDDSVKLDNCLCQEGVIESDLGWLVMEFGNAAGGKWGGVYRGFLMKDNKNNFFTIYMTILASAKLKDDPTFGNTLGESYLIVAIDDGVRSHNSLQLRLDKKKLIKRGQNYCIFHDGALTNGNKGKVSLEKVFSKIENECPSLLKNNRIYLGEFNPDEIMYVTDIKELIKNLIDYAVIRDKIRNENS